MDNEVSYKKNVPIREHDIIDVYDSSGIRRPTNDAFRIKEMFSNSNLIVSAWIGEKLIGVGRALTDFSYCCYVSDLAIKKEYQKQGIGKRILAEIKKSAGPRCVFFLHAAPSAKDYYPKIGMQPWSDCFYIPREF